jgi:hypothetical protein
VLNCEYAQARRGRGLARQAGAFSFLHTSCRSLPTRLLFVQTCFYDLSSLKVRLEVPVDAASICCSFSPFSPFLPSRLPRLVTFNSAILKTNFFTPTKVALSFRLDPAFLPESEYPVKAYGLFLVVGDGFRGFHLRFKDVARGGLRMIQSRNRENYSINQRDLFDEVYGLASTQALKNKDIPEGAFSFPLPLLRVHTHSYVDGS